MRYRFGDYEVDTGRFVLLRRGHPVRIEPKPLELLVRLLERHPDTVPKDELLDTLWPDTAVTEGSLTRAVGEVRRALRERAGSLGVIRTVRGRGYGIGLEVHAGSTDREPDRPGPAPIEERRTAERRLVAILSADAVGYSRLMAHDEAATVETIRAYRAVMGARIRDRRGRVVDMAGDSLLAEFPTALEAVEAAVAIQAELGRLNADHPADRVMPFRIGLHLGDIRAEEDGLYGDGVNIAARLQQLAPPGGLALSGAVHGQVAGKLELVFEDLGEQRVKNIVDPVRVYRVGLHHSLPESRPAESPAAPLQQTAFDFVGRARELEEATRALSQVLGGQGCVLLLVGEPGIGKTRLSEEVARHALSQGAEVLWGRCYEGEGRPAFWPWVQVLRTFLKARSDRELRDQMGRGAVDAAELVPEVRVRLPELPDLPRLRPEDARFRLFDSMTTLLKAAAVARPLALVLDDLHWADESSLRLLEFLAPEIAASRILLLGTYRENEAAPGTPLGRTLAELARTAHAKQVIRLSGLSSQESGQLSSSLARSAPSPKLLESIYERTEGNPLFVRELSQWILKALDGGNDRSAPLAALPESLRQVIGRRLAQLSEECHRTLLTASVIGRDFSLTLLARSEEGDEQMVLERLDEAEGARIVAEISGSPGFFRFTHALIRETLYNELRTARRVRLHRRVAEALDAMTADEVERPVAELAHHFSEAAALGGDTAKAVAYTSLAADRAESCFAFEEAVLQRERAVELYEAASPHAEEQRARLMHKLAGATARAGDPTRTIDVLWKTIAHARNARAGEVFGEAAIDLADEIGINRDTSSRVVPILEEALAGLPDGDSALRVGLLASLGRRCHDARRQRYSEAYAMARRLDDPKTLADWMWVRIDTCRAPSHEAERRRLIDERIDLAVRLRDKLTELRARDSRLELLLQLADPREFDREVGVALRLAEEIRTAPVLWAAESLESVRALWQGRLAQAKTHLAASLAKGQRVNPTFALSVFAFSVYLLRRFQGRLGELESAVQAGARQGDELGALRYRCHLVDLYVELGRKTEAQEAFAEIVPRRLDQLVALDTDAEYELALLSEACAQLGDEACSTSLHDRLLPFAGRYVALRWYSTLGCASRYLGLLATLQKRYGDAAGHFEEALRVERRMSARPWQAYTLIDYARMHIQRGGRGDGAIARKQLSEALAIAKAIGAQGIEAKARRVEMHL